MKKAIEEKLRKKAEKAAARAQKKGVEAAGAPGSTAGPSAPKVLCGPVSLCDWVTDVSRARHGKAPANQLRRKGRRMTPNVHVRVLHGRER